MQQRSNSTSNPDEASGSTSSATIAVVLTTFNDSDFLLEAIRSVLRQTRPPDEIVVVDDGSTKSPEQELTRYPLVRFLRKENGGLSSARNVGLLAVRSEYICFLDADDLLEPGALAAGLASFEQHPHAVMVYGGHRRTDRKGIPLGADHVWPLSHDAYGELLTTNFIGMHATVLYRRAVVVKEGGFDESLRMCEDYDLYLRLARK